MKISTKVVSVIAGSAVALAAVIAGTVISDDANAGPGALGRVLDGLGLEVSRRDCVDSEGENSTDYQLDEAGRSAPYLRYRDGNVYSYNALHDRLGDATPFMPVTEELRAVLDQLSAETGEDSDLYGSPPPGGDAKFAAAVCDTPDMWAMEYLSTKQVDTLAQTPHFLRALGRIACGTVQTDGSADGYLAEYSEKLAELQADPEGGKREAIIAGEQQVASLEQELPGAALQALSEPQRRQLIEGIEQKVYDARSSLETLHELSPEDFVTRAARQLEFQQTAVRYQCPQASEVGFGPECGPIAYPQSGGQSGVIKLRWEDEISCDDARAVLNNHFSAVLNTDSFGRLPENSPLQALRCETYSTAELSEGHHVLTSCSSGTSEYGDGFVIVPATE